MLKPEEIKKRIDESLASRRNGSTHVWAGLKNWNEATRTIGQCCPGS